MQAIKPKGNRAVIYVRVSTTRQADEASPEEQELECRALAERQGYIIVAIYRDIQKYKAGGRLVEPSATRSDRPAFRKMIADADANAYDVVLAWREDRLYRGVIRATLDITDRVRNGVFTIELARGNFDVAFAPVMAWAAGVELEAKRDRFEMGRRARAKRGAIWAALLPYGYDRAEGGETLEINEYEAYYVRQIFERYARGDSITQIRDYLVAEQAEQKAVHIYHRRFYWSPIAIRRILTKEYYATGMFPMKIAGEEYFAKIPTIIPMHIQQAVARRFKQFSRTKTGNVNHDEYLFVGKVFCGPCKVKMHLHRAYSPRPLADGTRKEYVYYRCNYRFTSRALTADMCGGSQLAWRVEEAAWDLIWREISVEGRLESLIQARIADLRTKQSESRNTIDELDAKLRDLDAEISKVLTWARKKIITEAQMEIQLSEIEVERNGIVKELSAAKLASQRDMGNIESMLMLVRENILGSVDALREPPISEEDVLRQFRMKKHFVDNFVEAVYIWRPNWKRDEDNRKGGGKLTEMKIKVDLSFDLSDFVINDQPH